MFDEAVPAVDVHGHECRVCSSTERIWQREKAVEIVDELVALVGGDVDGERRAVGDVEIVDPSAQRLKSEHIQPVLLCVQPKAQALCVSCQ